MRWLRSHPSDQIRYAPFCKHLFVENIWDDVYPGYLPLTEELIPLIKSDYLARRPEELAVLSRWVERQTLKQPLKPAKWIDCILYSREQIIKEAEAMGLDSKEIEEPWIVISLKVKKKFFDDSLSQFQNEENEIPMLPITAMRNCLIEEGGSGVQLNREKYRESVEFWSKHIEVK